MGPVHRSSKLEAHDRELKMFMIVFDPAVKSYQLMMMMMILLMMIVFH